VQGEHSWSVIQRLSQRNVGSGAGTAAFVKVVLVAQGVHDSRAVRDAHSMLQSAVAGGLSFKFS